MDSKKTRGELGGGLCFDKGREESKTPAVLPWSVLWPRILASDRSPRAIRGEDSPFAVIFLLVPPIRQGTVGLFVKKLKKQIPISKSTPINTMKLTFAPSIVAAIIGIFTIANAQDHPYLTTRSPVTLLSTGDGEFNQIFQFNRGLWNDRTTDWELKTKDSFTVIHLGPDHPPVIKTVYDTVPATIAGTPTMAMSKNGRYGLIANHGVRSPRMLNLIYPLGPKTNADLTPAMLEQQKMTAQWANMVSLVDLSDPNFKVVHRVLLADSPAHVLAHPDGEHFVVGATENFYVYKIVDAKLVEVSKNSHTHGMPCFWINPRGNRLIATHSTRAYGNDPATVQWYSIQDNRIRHLSEVKVKSGLPTELLPLSMILRVSLDGKMALICQRSTHNGINSSDVLIADLTLEQPAITDVIKQVSDGVESFAFHPNGKMAVATGLGSDYNSIAVIDIASKPARLLYTMEAKGFGQGIEFTPEGDKLFVGSALAGRIEVFDVVGDYQLQANPKFLNVGFGHNSLTIGPRYRPAGQ
ncbi:MAG: WD40 repeat domain-containing protein [Verrucomicrobia bacterium]|nr:WD40 repeat domain-containing protein [Verrucomicrobiota bacterium]